MRFDGTGAATILLALLALNRPESLGLLLARSSCCGALRLFAAMRSPAWCGAPMICATSHTVLVPALLTGVVSWRSRSQEGGFMNEQEQPIVRAWGGLEARGLCFQLNWVLVRRAQIFSGIAKVARKLGFMFEREQ